jgi:transcriptional regulator with XRE-family HTH domain
MNNNIDRLRKAKGLTYAGIAERAGLTTNYICMIAKGKRQNPSLEAMQKISQALDEKVERVFRLNNKKQIV